MSQISASSVAALGSTTATSATTINTSSGTGLNPVGGSDGSVGTVSGTSSVTRSGQTFSLSSSRMSLSGSSDTAGDKLAAMVLALLEIVLGLKDKDKDDNNKLLAGLLGMLALSGSRRSGSDLQSLELTQSSQVTQVTTTMNSSAVQASAYTRAAGGAESGGASTGGTLNIVA
jgi:hypothetical protein